MLPPPGMGLPYIIFILLMLVTEYLTSCACYQNSDSQTELILPPRGPLTMSEDICGCCSGMKDTTIVSWAEAKDSVVHVVKLRALPPIQITVQSQISRALRLKKLCRTKERHKLLRTQSHRCLVQRWLQYLLPMRHWVGLNFGI